MNKRSDSIALAEQRVAEARTAMLAEYEAARAKLNRRMRSPVFIGGAVLGAIALGYLALSRGKPRAKPKYLVDPGSHGAWSGAVKTVQVLLPLLIALNSATRTARRPNAILRESAK